MSDTDINADFPKPSDHLTVRVNGEEQRVFMSFALLRRVTTLVGGMGMEDGAIGSFLLEGNRMAALVDLMLSPKNFDAEDIKDYEISHEDALSLALWGLKHALRFFAVNLQGMDQLTQEAAPLLQSLTNSMRSAAGSTL